MNITINGKENVYEICESLELNHYTHGLNYIEPQSFSQICLAKLATS